MPVTLGRQDYLDVMSKKGTTEDEAGAHFDRMAVFRAKFAPGGEALLGCVDVGQTAYWCDPGRLNPSPNPNSSPISRPDSNPNPNPS